jgi:hypothetical protein
MKPASLLPLAALAAALCAWVVATDSPPATASPKYEYATLRWDGPQNTHVIYPSGNVEVLGRQLVGIRKPDRADERAFYMNLAANALGREGYELVAMTPDDYMFRRTVTR